MLRFLNLKLADTSEPVTVAAEFAVTDWFERASGRAGKMSVGVAVDFYSDFSSFDLMV